MTDRSPRRSPLRRRMVEDMTVRHLSPATQRSYLHAIAKFSRHFGRLPARQDLEDVRAYQVYLVPQGISLPALNQPVCALRFSYGVTLNRPEIPERIAYAREPRKLPVTQSTDGVVRFLEAVPSLKARTALTTAYGVGLRASETVGLKVADIDTSRMLIHVRHGKGAKDRSVMLSPQLLTILRTYWRLARPKEWLFPARDDPPPASQAHKTKPIPAELNFVDGLYSGSDLPAPLNCANDPFTPSISSIDLSLCSDKVATPISARSRSFPSV